MFDWNGNGKHDAFDDFVTFGLIHHIIEDSKKNEQPPVQNNRRGIYRHYDNTDTRSEAVKCLWMIFGIAILIGGVALTVCFFKSAAFHTRSARYSDSRLYRSVARQRRLKRLA